jgi:lycopene beta-cyclase
MSHVNDFDYAVIGGGLQGCLMLHAIGHRQPDAKVLLVERDDALCGNHTWSFHRSDVSDSAQGWFSDLVDFSWDSYEVRLGDFVRRVNVPYGSIASESLANRTERLLERQPNFKRIQNSVVELTQNRIVLEGGEQVEATVVLDARGSDPALLRKGGTGFQKFVGLEVELASDWVSQSPTLMDDSVEQSDGFRFVYALPFSKRRVLVEDTTFSASPHFCESNSVEVIDQYLKRHGHHSYDIKRRESGCLPMPYVRQRRLSKTATGYRGGFFHPATGYSIPLAANLANAIASEVPSRAVEVIADFRSRNNFQHTVSLWLNRMLFQLIKPHHRSQIFRRFYKNLSAESVGRFYAHRFTSGDIFQMMVGRPPSGLTPIRFLRSFGEKPCPAL